MVNNYDLRIRQRRGSRMLSEELQREKYAAWACGSSASVISSMRQCTSSISARGLFNISQYCESEDFLFQHLHFITHVCTCVSEEGEENTHTHRERKKERKGRGRSQIGCLPESLLMSTKGEMELIFQTCIRAPRRKQVESVEIRILQDPSVTESVNALSSHLPSYGESSVLDKWDARFMRGGWEACLDWFWHRDICSVLPCCVPVGLVGGLGLTGHELVAGRPLVADHSGQSLKAARIPQVHSDWYYQRKSRLQGARDQLCPCQ